LLRAKKSMRSATATNTAKSDHISGVPMDM